MLAGAQYNALNTLHSTLCWLVQNYQCADWRAVCVSPRVAREARAAAVGQPLAQGGVCRLDAKHPDGVGSERTVLFLVLPRYEAFGLLSRRRFLEAAAQTISTKCVHLPKESPPGCWAALRCRRAAGARAWPHRVSQLRVRDRLDSGLDHVLVAALRVVREADDVTACAVDQTRERGNTRNSTIPRKKSEPRSFFYITQKLGPQRPLCWVKAGA